MQRTKGSYRPSKILRLGINHTLVPFERGARRGEVQFLRKRIHHVRAEWRRWGGLECEIVQRQMRCDGYGGV